MRKTSGMKPAGFFSESSVIADCTWCLRCLVFFQHSRLTSWCITDYFFVVVEKCYCIFFFAIEWLAQPPGVLAVKLDSKTKSLFLCPQERKLFTVGDIWGGSGSDRKTLKWPKDSISYIRTVKTKWAAWLFSNKSYVRGKAWINFLFTGWNGAIFVYRLFWLVKWFLTSLQIMGR